MNRRPIRLYQTIVQRPTASWIGSPASGIATLVKIDLLTLTTIEANQFDRSLGRQAGSTCEIYEARPFESESNVLRLIPKFVDTSVAK